MGLIKGGFLRFVQTALYFLAFCCGAIILGFYSYFLSILADRDVYINKTNQAIEGISGAAVLYTILAVLLTCCLGGVTFFAFLGLVLDILFVGGFIALAVLTRDGAHSCTGNINTPIGYGPAEYGLGWDAPNGRDQITYSVKFRTACRFNKACFAVSIIGAFIFILTALMQVALTRNHKKEKAYGPGPSNNYTSGFGKKKGSLFARNKKTKDVEYTAAGGLAAPHAADIRPSHDTGYTGTTVGGTAIHNDKAAAPAALPTHGGYHTAPQGTGVNPYGYTNTTTATNY